MSKNGLLIWSLVVNDLRERYFDNFFRLAWALIQPTVTILIFWFVFQVGFKAQPVNDMPFILWLSTGMIAWFFFSDMLGTGVGSVIEKEYLVKKIVFKVQFLPIVKLLSASIIHIFFILLLFLMYIVYGYEFKIHWIQIFYYSFSLMFFTIGLMWFTSSVVVFFKDVGQIVAMILQFGFWLTPIFWSLEMIPKKYHWFIEVNPLLYIVEGYRDSMTGENWFWDDSQAYVFWLIAIFTFIIGRSIFNRLKPHFSDVL